MRDPRPDLTPECLGQQDHPNGNQGAVDIQNESLSGHAAIDDSPKEGGRYDEWQGLYVELADRRRP
jgi:hypothetical protein